MDDKPCQSDLSSVIRSSGPGKDGLMSTITSTLLSYSTVRVANIHSWKVALFFRSMQIIIIGYIIGYDIIYMKGYQQFDSVSSAVTSKVKGVGYLNYSNVNPDTIVKVNDQHLYLSDFESKQTRIFDTADYIIPPSEYNSIFIMTNFVETRQTQSKCEEDYRSVNCLCTLDTDCTMSKVENNWNGLPTGKCIRSQHNTSLKVCEIYSWCPVERDFKKNLIKNVQNFTIFIKNDVLFPLFDRKLRNLLPNITNSYISRCAYLPREQNPYCPVFRVGDILNEAEPNATEQKLMMEKGGVIQVSINWQCNFDSSRLCTPIYSFNRFDLPAYLVSAASGFNFRFANKFEINSIMYRVVVKAYGLRFIITVDGTAGKFSLIPLMMSVGAGLGLLGLATIVADIVLVTCTKNRETYQRLIEIEYKKKMEKKESPFVNQLWNSFDVDLNIDRVDTV